MQERLPARKVILKDIWLDERDRDVVCDAHGRINTCISHSVLEARCVPWESLDEELDIFKSWHGI
jgi:hypothetical protein